MTTKERPILFSGTNVRAILQRRKTHTRRVMSPQPVVDGDRVTWWPKTAKVNDVGLMEPMAMWRSGMPIERTGAANVGSLCPYGKPGDRLWVRETAKATASEEGIDCVHYAADDWCRAISNNEVDQWRKMRGYRNGDGSWVTSIHMPRWASRITLEIVSVRVERLQDISEADAMAEGVVVKQWNSSRRLGPRTEAVNCFGSLWQKINGPGSWAANPWVWVVEFKKLEQGT